MMEILDISLKSLSDSTEKVIKNGITCFNEAPLGVLGIRDIKVKKIIRIRDIWGEN